MDQIVARILRWRHAAQVAIRVMAFIWLAVALWFGLSDFRQHGWLSGISSIRWERLKFDALVVGMSAAPSIVAMLLSRRLARWLVPLPRMECPQCGYALRHLTTARCPECGLDFAYTHAERREVIAASSSIHE